MLNSDNCCFLLIEELYIWLNNILFTGKYRLCKDYILTSENDFFNILDINIVDSNNERFKLNIFTVTKNLYFLVKDFMNSLEIIKGQGKFKYEDIKYVKDNGAIIFDFEQEKKNNNYYKIDEKLKNIKLNSDSKIEVFVKDKFIEDVGNYLEYSQKTKNYKKLKCCQRVKC